MAETKSEENTVTYVTYEKNPEHGCLLVTDILQYEMSPASRAQARRKVMRDLGRQVDTWLNGGDYMELRAELPGLGHLWD